MNGYFANFLIYTLAMTGIMLLAIIIYKKSTLIKQFGQHKKTMEIEESLNLSPKKTLHVVKVGEEKFLIAADTDRTSFLAKLNTNDTGFVKTVVQKNAEINDYVPVSASKKEKYERIIPGIDPFEIRQSADKKLPVRNKRTFSQTLADKKNEQSPVMKNLASKIALIRG